MVLAVSGNEEPQRSMVRGTREPPALEKGNYEGHWKGAVSRTAWGKEISQPLKNTYE